MIKKILTVLLCSFALFSCGGGSSSSSSLKKISINVGEEGKTLDPQLLTDNSGGQIHSFLSEGLTKLDASLKAEPGLAKSWDISENGLVWTFHLRDGIKWSNGDPITANDFKFAWLRALDPNTAAEYAYMFYQIVNAEEYNTGKAKAEDVGIKVIDDKTLEVTLKSPTPYFDSLVAFTTYLPTSEKFFKETGDQFALEADKMLYSGPYILDSWTHNSEMKLTKNPNYYDKDQIKIDEVSIKFIQDSGAELNAFKNEEIDIAKLTSEQYQEFKNDPRVNQVLQATVWYLEFNVKHKALNNPKIRQALLMAVDKEEMIKVTFNDINIPVYSLVPTGVGINGVNGDFAKEVGEVVPKFNVEKAKQLLAEGLKEEGLEKLPPITMILNDSGSNKKLGETIQEYLRVNLGVDLKIELMAFKERLARMKSGDFDIVLAGWGADYQDPLTFLDLFVTNGGNNHTGYSNPEYDKLIKFAQVESDNVKRTEALIEAEKILARDLPIGVLFQVRRNFIISDRVKGAIFPALGAEIVLNKADVVK